MIFNDIEDSMINIVDYPTTKKLILDVIKDVSDGIKHSMGVAGRTTLLHDPNGISSLYPSKDGFRNVLNMHFDDVYAESIYMILRDISVRMNQNVGDGTTSCIVIMEEFYKKILDLYENKEGSFKYISANGITQILEVICKVLQDELYNKKYIVKLEDLNIEDRKKIIRKVGSIAANNDRQIGEEVGGLYDNILENLDDLFVSILPNEGSDNTILSEIGFEAPIGAINRVFATERDGITAIYEDPRFLMIEGPLLDGDAKFLQPIIERVCLDQGKPLVIIADDFSNVISDFLYRLRLGGLKFVHPTTGKESLLPPFKILPIMHSTNFDLGHERMIDLNTALGGQVQVCQSHKLELPPSTGEQIDLMLGRANKIIAAEHLTRIFGGKGDKEKITGRISELQAHIDNMVMKDSDRAQSRVWVYKERIGMLKSNMVSIKVGGQTYKEKQYKVLVYEDAVYAIRSTIKNGYTLGGQVCIEYLIRNNMNDLIDKIYTRIHDENRAVMFGKRKKTALKEIIGELLSVIKSTINVAYKIALKNAIVDEKEFNDVLETLFSDYKYIVINNKNDTKTEERQTEPMTYNVIDDTYETLHINNNLFVAGNTDFEILESIVGVTKNFLNAEYIQSIYIPKRKAIKHGKGSPFDPNDKPPEEKITKLNIN
jgi:chaperonin GroEL